MVLVGMRKYQAVYFFHFIIFKKLQNVGRIFLLPRINHNTGISA